jgi:hypothetical protein
MQRSTRNVFLILAGLFALTSTLWASKEAVETRLGRDIVYLNHLGRSHDGESSLTQSLESQFRAASGRISEMRKARLGYGDISVVLALASHLKGHVSRANVERIIALRRSPRFGGWGKIATSLGIRLDRVVLQVESLRVRPMRKPAAAVDQRPSYDSVHRPVKGG